MTTNKKAKLSAPLSDRNNVMLRAERVLGDVVDGAILVDHQDVVLAVAPRTWPALRHCHHRLHRNHHSRLDHSLNIFPQFKTSLTPVVVGNTAKTVSITK